MRQFIRVGVDLSKNFFQIHALESEDGPALKRKLSRTAMRNFFSEIAPCRVAMEACASAHYWGRELAAMGHDVRLIPPIYVKPYVKRGKNDAADAEAICEAASRPLMRFVPIKSADNQAALALHKTRELLIKQRTMSINALRAHMAEFGLVAAKGPQNVAGLVEAARDDETLPQALREVINLFVAHIAALAEKIAALGKKIASLAAREPMVRLLRRIPGVGKLSAAALVASLPDPGAFDSGRDFSAWLGLTPRQNSSGGKDKLGAITKRGDAYLRKLLVLGATALLRLSKKRTGALADWITALCARKPHRLASVAIANKLARIVLATMKSGECFRRENFAKV